MTLKLYADECVDDRIIAGLRRRAVDVLTVGERDLLGADDETHLQHAQQLGRSVLTNDTDFLRMAHDCAQRGAPHPGVIFIQPRTTLGDAIRRVALLARALEPAQIENWVEWVG